MSHAHLALLQRAFEIDISDLIAQVGRLVDQGDKTIFHSQSDFSTWFDVLAENTGGAYVQAGATGGRLEGTFWHDVMRGEVRFGWVGGQVYKGDVENVVLGIGAVLYEKVRS